MVKRIGLSTAKAQFSAVVESVLNTAEPYVIERRGRPVAAIVPAENLERFEPHADNPPRKAGALALLGLWGDDAEIDEFLAIIRASREQDTGRPVPEIA